MKRHVHDWKDAPDWEFGDGTVTTQECFGCRSLRLVQKDPGPYPHIPDPRHPAIRHTEGDPT